MGNLPDWAIGILAGIASALLYSAASTGALAAMALLYVAPLPIFIAGLGWGTTIGMIAGGTGIVLMALFGGISNAVVYMGVAALGPIWLTRLALLGRPVGGRGASAAARAARAREAHHRAVADGSRDGPPSPPPEPEYEWYPPGQLVVWTTSIAAVLLAFSIFSMMAADGGIRAAVVQVLNTGILDTGELARTLEAQGIEMSAAEFLENLAALVPALTASIWVILTLLNMLAAQLILARSGQARRPTPELSGMTYPQLFAFALPAALVMSFLPGEFGFAGMSLVAVFFTPYFLLGLVVIHAISRGWQGRPFVLAFVYLAIVIFGWVVVLIGILGLVEVWWHLRDRYAAGSGHDGS